MKISKRTNKKLGWRRDLPDRRDFMLSVVKPKTVPKIVNLESKFGAIGVYNQGNLGSCTANAIAGAVVYCELNEVNDSSMTLPSRLFIYYCEREIEGSIASDAGAEIRDGMKVVAKLGYPQETSWPYKVGQFATKPPASVYAEAKKDHILSYYRVKQTVQAMRLCLAHGFPFVFGISVYSNFWDRSSGDIAMPSGSLEGGHAILCTGYDDVQKYFKFRNSWGASWGDNGSGRIPYEYLADPNLAGDFWTIRKETI